MISNFIFLILFFISKIPIKALYSISKIIQLFNFIWIKYRITIVRKNIKQAFPMLDHKKHEEIKNQFYNYFFNTLFEIIKSISLNAKNIKKRVKINNPEIIQKIKDSNKPIILITSHYGNWEWLFLRVGLIPEIKLSAVYKPLSNKYFNYILLKIRSKFGAKLIPLKEWKYFILNNKETSNAFMFIADQVPEHEKIGQRIQFLNQSTLFHQGAEKITNLLKCDVFYVEMNILQRGYYSILFKKISEKTITKQYAKLLEKTITKQPENWLWSHNRWKR